MTSFSMHRTLGFLPIPSVNRKLVQFKPYFSGLDTPLSSVPSAPMGTNGYSLITKNTFGNLACISTPFGKGSFSFLTTLEQSEGLLAWKAVFFVFLHSKFWIYAEPEKPKHIYVQVGPFMAWGDFLMCS